MKTPKAKGSSYERKVSKMLSLWLSDGESNDWVWRTASSGAKATQVASSKYYHGDLMPVHEKANWFFNYFSVECKNVAKINLNLFHLFTGSKIQLHQYWKQSVNDAVKSHRIPLLIFHLPHTKFELLMFRISDFKYIDFKLKWLPFIELPSKLTVYRLDQVLQHIDSVSLKFYLQNERRK